MLRTTLPVRPSSSTADAPLPNVPLKTSRPRPWLDHYDYWVPHHTNYPRRPLYEILRRAAAEGGELPATTFLGADLTFAELKDKADRLATALARHGVVKGDRVGIMLPNCPQYLIGVFAVLRLGAIVVNINPAYAAPEVEHLVRDSGIRMLLTLDRLAPAVATLRSGTNLETIVITALSEYSPEAKPPAAFAQTIRLADLHRRIHDHRPAARRHRSRRRCGRPAIHGRHNRRAESGDADASQHLREHDPDRAVASPQHRAWPRPFPDGDSVLPHLRPDRGHDAWAVAGREADPDSKVQRRGRAGGATRLSADLFPRRADDFRFAVEPSAAARVQPRSRLHLQQRLGADRAGSARKVRADRERAAQPGLRIDRKHHQ